MNNVGRLLFVVGLALAVFFTALSCASVAYFFFIDPTGAITQSGISFAFLVALPLLLAVISIGMSYVGWAMQRGKRARVGGIFIIVIGLISLSLSLAAGHTTTGPVVALSVIFGLTCIGWGVSLIVNGKLSDKEALYPLHPSDPIQTKERGRVLIWGVLISIPLVVLQFYFFVH